MGKTTVVNKRPNLAPESGARSLDPLVALILKGFPRVSETFITREIHLLEQMGFSFWIFSLRNPQEHPIHGHIGKIRASVTYLPEFVLPALGRILRVHVRLLKKRPMVYMKTLGSALWWSIRSPKSSALKRFMQAGYLVGQYLNNFAVVHLHAHFCHDPTTVAYYASLLSGISYSFMAHAKDIYTSDRALLRAKLSRALFSITCTMANAQYLDNLTGHKTPVAYHGVDLELFQYRGDDPRLEEPPIILTVGRVVPKKGHQILLQALIILRDRGLQYRWAVVGEGPLLAELKLRIREAALESRAEFLGSLTQESLVEWYRRASVCALACQVMSDGDRDGIPNVLVESMAVGVSVVCTTISGIPELVEDGVQGFLVPPGNPKEMADALERILRDPQLMRAMGRAGRRTVERTFDASKNIEEVGLWMRRAIDRGTNW
jgi:glycosyltransferase involved in cell wall biosynthesis